MVTEIANEARGTRAIVRQALAIKNLGDIVFHRVQYGTCGQKNKNKPAALLAPLILRSAAPLFASADLLVPVPTHRWRLARRRFHQSAELARALSRLTGVPMRVQVLERHRATAQQVGLTRAARRANLRGAFRVREAE